MEPSDEQSEGGDSARAPRIGVRLMVVILSGLALVAIYANIQKARRDQIEQVSIEPVSAAIPTPAASPRP